MESTFKSFFSMLKMVFLTILNTARIFNNFANAAVIRSDVVVDNAAYDASLSSLNKRNTFAKELETSKKEAPSDTLLKAADEYINHWKHINNFDT